MPSRRSGLALLVLALLGCEDQQAAYLEELLGRAPAPETDALIIEDASPDLAGDPDAAPMIQETCDGLDEDGDARIDEGAVLAGATCCGSDPTVERCAHCPPATVLPDGWRCIPAADASTIGSPSGEQCAEGESREGQVVARVPRPYLILATELTRQSVRALRAGGPPALAQPDLPADELTWFDAAAICNALSRHWGLTACYRTLEGVTYDFDDADGGVSAIVEAGCDGVRLPTELEWEHAARAGAVTPTFAGAEWRIDDECRCSEALSERAWYACTTDENATEVVGLLAANPWGLWDVHGNAKEWVEDVHRRPSVRTVDAETLRALKGGGAGSRAENCRLGAQELRRPVEAGGGLRPVLTNTQMGQR